MNRRTLLNALVAGLAIPLAPDPLWHTRPNAVAAV